AHINDAQRQPKKDLSTNSGMGILQIISEPTAAIAYGLDMKIEMVIQVFNPSEDKAAEKIREVITNKFTDINFKPDCETYVECVWDAEAAKRPQDPMTNDAAEPVAPQRQIEDKAVWGIAEKFPNVKLNPVYKTDIDSACDAAVAKCPQELKTLASPTSIEKLIYETALRNQIGDKVVEEIRQVSGAK
ncbi:unnamed protein product, partial [Prorocentrum cordatum]